MRPSLIFPIVALLASTTFAQTTPATTKPATTAAPKLPFSISKETTRITGPLRPDG